MHVARERGPPSDGVVQEVAACQFRGSSISIFCIRATRPSTTTVFRQRMPTRVSRFSRVCLMRGGPNGRLHCKRAFARRARTVLFFAFDVEARGPIPSATKINTAGRGGERGKTYFEINEQN